MPVEDVSVQEAEKQRVENEKTFKRNSALSVVPRKSANQNSHRSKKTQRQIRREQREVVSRQKKVVRSLTKTSRKWEGINRRTSLPFSAGFFPAN